MQEKVMYVTDDRDLPDEDQRSLVIFQGGNGDWPEHDAMEAKCPRCGSTEVVDISTVKDFQMQCRPVHCSACSADFEVRSDGSVIELKAIRTTEGLMQDVYKE